MDEVTGIVIPRAEPLARLKIVMFRCYLSLEMAEFRQDFICSKCTLKGDLSSI